MQQSLVAIKSIADSANSTMSSNTKTAGSSGLGKTIGVVVAVVVVVLLAVCGVVLVFIMRRRKKRRAAQEAAQNKKPEEDPAEAIRQGFAKAELNTDFDHVRYEMGGPDVIEQKVEKPPAEWVSEKARYPGEWSVVAEAPGEDVNVPELGSTRIVLRPLHEMYDPSMAPAELPADTPVELPGSPPPPPTSFSPAPRSAARSLVDRSMAASPLSRSSDQPSPIDRHPGRTPPPQSSSRHQHSIPFSPSQPLRGLSLPSRSGTPSARTNEVLSPISPLGDGDTSPGQEGLFSFVRGLTQPSAPETRPSNTRQAAGDKGQGTGESHS